MLADRLSGATAPDSGDVAIRRASLSDWPAIQVFLAASYGSLAQFKGEARWSWQFLDNPFRWEIGPAPSVWIAVSGDTVVGQIAVQAALFWVNREEKPGGWIVDVMILPQYRGKKLGHRLYQAVAAEVPLLVMLTMAPATRRMALRGGAVTLNPATQFSRWTRFAATDVSRFIIYKLLERPRLTHAAKFAFHSLRLHYVVAAAVNTVLVLRQQDNRRIAPDCSVEEADVSDVEFDAFWQLIRQYVDGAAVRNTSYMVWRFKKCPDLRYRCFVVRRNGIMVGYSILRVAEPFEQRLGFISDLLTVPGDAEALNSLMWHAIGFFGRAVCSVEFVTSIPQWGKHIRKMGFIPTRSTRATCSLGLWLDQAGKVDFEDKVWLFTKSDHDWDQIQVA
jgi:GNAT superfamily N-acetyltransferase